MIYDYRVYTLQHNRGGVDCYGGVGAMHHTEIHPDIVDILKQKRGGKFNVHEKVLQRC